MIPSPLRKHRVPYFQGPYSRRHQSIPVWKLWLQSAVVRAKGRARFDGVSTFLQFVGFPRSGHSLIGSILDAHPQALIAHELDAMGLLDQGLSEKSIFALIARNSDVFSENGRYWNGFRYEVPGQRNGEAKEIRVIGDKKGDWVARRVGKNPQLLEKASRRIGAKCRWILVVRHPLDNIATMSLREGRLYDQLRIETKDSSEFRETLRDRQQKGEIASTALDSMLGDYRTLCDAIEMMKGRLDPEDWHEVVYEDFTQDPQIGIRGLLAFVDLKIEDSFVEAASSLVHPSARRSRDDLAWSDDQLAAVREMIGRYSFLKIYADEA